ncbi:MAG: hypothetical protein K2H31_07355 [Lachnospiraceae bacterium]|nr:hypothetical protein [Lachnospiraceae bacterium]
MDAKSGNNNETKPTIKIIRIIVFSIMLLLFMSVVIVEYVDIMKIRSILLKILCVVCFLLIIILKKEPKFAASRVTVLDVLSIVMFIGVMAYLGKALATSTIIQTAFQGNNGFVYSYSEGNGDKGYDDIEIILEYEMENIKKSGKYNELEEIYRMQVGEKIFVYFKEEGKILEIDFLRQNDLYYCSGSNVLLYDGIGSSDRYTTEETIRKDIANTMWRGVGLKEIGAPAWGVSDDEQIFSLTINSEKVDDVILIDEKDGKKYYFWIMTNLEEIETIDDVKAAEIHMGVR